MVKTISTILSVIILTLVVVAINPKMHKPTNIGSSKIGVLHQNNIKNTQNTALKNIENIQNTSNISTKNIDPNLNYENNLEIYNQDFSKQPPEEITFKPKRIKRKQQKRPEPQITELKKEISWNYWKTQICNTIGHNLDPKFTQIAPLGTTYAYTFTVSNKGEISNISIKIVKGYINSLSLQGIDIIKDSILSLNQNDILIFPTQSQRDYVTVSSGIQSAKTTQEIQEDEFNDIETVIIKSYK